jgi:manganese transport protein
VIGRTKMLGPAFVAAIAYVDPGNVATNTAAGATYGYLLVWVLVGATAMAGLVQYLSAKVGWLSGASLPRLVGDRTSRPVRLAYWVQAELVALATDLAEIVGGALALQLLFGVPLLIGALITTGVSMLLLVWQRRQRQHIFERVITGLLLVVTFGFLAGLVVSPPDPSATLAGLIPRLEGAPSALLAVGMLGATVMPHAVYLHSALVLDRHGRADASRVGLTLRTIRWDIGLAMVVAGSVNVGMLLVAASALTGRDVADLGAAQAGLTEELGSAIGLAFAIALLASGLASTAVGGYAGAVIMEGLLHRSIPVLVRRLVTAVPALVLLALGADATQLLILSQVVLSFGIPLALIPLVRLTANAELMTLHPTRRITTVVAWIIVALVSALNLVLIWLTVGSWLG